MKHKYQTVFTWLVVLGAVLLQLKRGLFPSIEPGFTPGGAINEPLVAVFYAALTGAVIWVLLQALFWAVSKTGK